MAISKTFTPADLASPVAAALTAESTVIYEGTFTGWVWIEAQAPNGDTPQPVPGTARQGADVFNLSCPDPAIVYTLKADINEGECNAYIGP